MTSVEPATDPTLRHALACERAYHDTCRAALAAMVEGAGEQVVVGEDVSASGADAEVLGYRLRSRAKEMRELPEGPLFFGRLDFDDHMNADHANIDHANIDHAGQSYHVGRLRISEDPALPPLVVDWRAPVSRAFYQASSRDPQGVAVRRRFGWAQGSRGESADLTGLEDEHLDRRDAPTGRGPASPGGGQDGRSGQDGEDGRGGSGIPGSLLAVEIERPRLGPMRDIAATIQPEQDDLVRADLGTSVCVQGAPGTGKTAVGLHRAAYLLYTYPQRIRRGGLLILGPNRTFLSYIAEVLPALGETGVRQSTVTDEIARQPVTGEDDERAAAVKHDARMAGVLRRALYAGAAGGGGSGERFNSLVLSEGSFRWRVSGDELRRIVADVRAEALPYDIGRERVRARVVRLLQVQAERRSGPRPNAWLYRISRSRPVGAYVDAVWPKARPEEVVARLLGDPDALADAAEGLLDADERKAVSWARPPRTWRSARWSAADLVLLDEVAGLLAHPDGYGHVVVDEAQDLSPMECRVIARRAAYGSVTVLGDLAQGTTPWAARDWPRLLAHLGKPDAHVIPLTTGFRVPQAVVGLANGLLGRLGVDVPAARSLRRDGELRIRRVDGTEAEGGGVVTETVAAVRDALAREGSIGVIAADGPDVVRLREALGGAGIATGGPGELGARVTVLGAGVAKGLEYDHVVVVEPAAIVAAEGRGLHRLYVVLTRAVSRLDVVHARALPW
ncbi:HelD family protein [Streptomyces europaeiscabiei]|uniref:HelD family protein n=1 Tax=Streptomyces europaeiscabiei TaxID=146819 RepID=UPI0029A88C1F|nr:AAA family ATPase [Streptomyces europaeiscabiei]MDX2773517.1 AAA family ATPase [Streptomyces europaeiscabiei]